MSKRARKYEAMYMEYGRDPDHRCGQCSNFIRFDYHGKNLQKCNGYGLTHSEASDWRQFWAACGMYNKPFEGQRPLIECLTHKAIADGPIEGQMTLE